MNNQKRIKFLTWLMFFLLLLNISIIITFIYTIKKYPRFDSYKERIDNKNNSKFFPGPPFQNHFELKEILIKELDLSIEQIEQIDILRKGFKDKSHDYFSKIEKYSDLIDNELEKDIPDTAQINSLAIKIGLVHKDLKLHFVDFFFDIKKILTDEQKLKYYKVFKEFKEMKKVNKPHKQCKHLND